MGLCRVSRGPILLLCLLGVLAASALAQSSDTLSLSCRNADIIEVLRAIGQQKGVNLVPDSTVSGKVTVQLTDAPFETGLKTILEMNGLEYAFEDGIYRIRRKSTEPETLTLSVTDGKLTLDARGADVKLLVRQLSAQAGVNIISDGNLTGTVTAHVTGIDVEKALAVLFAADSYTLRKQSGVYRVGNRAPQQRGSFSIHTDDGLVNLDARGAPVADVLQELATQTGTNLVVVGNTAVGNAPGSVTMRLEGVSLEAALGMIASASGTAYTWVDGIMVVGDPTVKPGVMNPLLKRRVFWLKHIEATEVLNALPADLPRASVTLSQDRNALIVVATPEMIAELEKVLTELDVTSPDIRSRQQWALWVDVSEEGRVSVDAKDVPMEWVMRELSIQLGLDVVVIDTSTSSRPVSSAQAAPAGAPVQSQAQPNVRPRNLATRSRGLEENVNLRIDDATLEETLAALFKGSGYTYQLSPTGEKQLYVVGTGDLSLGEVNPLTVSKVIPLDYLDVTKVSELLPATVSQNSITLLPDQNAIALLDTPEMVAFLTEYLDAIDQPTPQVMIEALLLELTKGSTRDLGLNWGAKKQRTVLDVDAGVNLVFDSLSDVPEAFDASLNVLLSENKARILASPRVAVLSGETANIDVGVRYLFQTEVYTDYYRPPYLTPTETGTGTGTGSGTTNPGSSYYPGSYYSPRQGFNTIDTGIQLDITPWVGNAGEITMNISPRIRDADDVSAEQARIADRTLDTVIRVRDGGMVVIGGLLQEKELTQRDKVPVLGSIPLLGRLFSSEHKVGNQSELMMVLKPRLIASHSEQQGQLDSGTTGSDTPDQSSPSGIASPRESRPIPQPEDVTTPDGSVTPREKSTTEGGSSP